LPPLIDQPQSDDSDDESEPTGSEDDHDLSGDPALPPLIKTRVDTDHDDSASARRATSAIGRRSRADYEERESESDADEAKTHSSNISDHDARPIKRCRSSSRTISEGDDSEDAATETEDEGTDASLEDNHSAEPENDDTTASEAGYDADTSNQHEDERDAVSEAGYEADDEGDGSHDEHESKEASVSDNEDVSEDEEDSATASDTDTATTSDEHSNEEEATTAKASGDDERTAQELSNESDDYPSTDDRMFNYAAELVRNPPRPREVTPYEDRILSCPNCGRKVRGGALKHHIDHTHWGRPRKLALSCLQWLQPMLNSVCCYYLLAAPRP
jgi:hypothetical protein